MYGWYICLSNAHGDFFLLKTRLFRLDPSFFRYCTLTLPYFCVSSLFNPIPNNRILWLSIILEIELFTALNSQTYGSSTSIQRYVQVELASQTYGSSTSIQRYVQVELASWKTWITLERKHLLIRGLHYWKARAEAVKNIPSVYSKTGEKVLFQNSIQKSMGIEKTAGFPLKTRPLLVPRYGSIDHANCLH